MPTKNTEYPSIELLQPETYLSKISQEAPSHEELRTALSLVDLTTLEGKDTTERVQEMCKKAVASGVAAVCVYPTLVSTAKETLVNSGKKVASVAGAFPSGQLPLELRLKEAEYALAEGADEIDMVISRGRFMEGDAAFLAEEVAAFKKVCGAKTLKVILETGELENLQLISNAARIALEAGADFIKTSTGKTGVNATLPAVCVMLLAIRDHHVATGKKAGIKPSGGISDGKTAVQYLRLTEQILGKEWLTPSLFRFGASRLVDNLFLEIQGKSGHAGSGY